MCYGGGFDIAGKQERIEVLGRVSAEPSFWDDSTAAQKTMRELTTLQNQVNRWNGLSQRLADNIELAEFDDPDMLAEIETETKTLVSDIEKLEFTTLFAGQYDDKPAILAIHAGAGGTESQDWAAMLRRMFVRWCDAHDMKVEVLDEAPGDITGLKSTTLAISGDHAHGWLRSEKGVHRLVRISPYDSSARRHTSFAKVEVWPDIAEEIDIEINMSDVEEQRFKASGAGGQHVQKNETAVRLIHHPTGIVVSCQNQRSLTQNRESALNVLKVQLYEREQAKQQAELDMLKGENVDAGWGSQIRSYVLHPYKMVKDHRTSHETGNPSKVLDGDLDSFMGAYLRFLLGEQTEG